MALERGPVLYPKPRTRTTAGETVAPGAGEYDIEATADTGAGTTLTGASGVSSPATLFQVFPNGTGTLGSTSGVASTTLANGKGWLIPATTIMGSTSSAQRVILANKTATLSAQGVATGLTGSDTITASLYRRNAAGTSYTLLCQGTYAAANGAGGGTSYTASIPATFPASDTVFAPGETLYVELYVSVVGQTVTAGTITINVNSGTPWTFASPDGIGFRYSATATDSAPASDTPSRMVTRIRAVTDSAPAADVTTRSVNNSRFITDSAPASDSLTRQLIVVRRTNEYLGGPPDYPVTTSATITGLVTTNGIAQAGATCRLLRDSDEFLAGTVTTGADGRYSFTRDKNDPNTYHVEVYVGTTLHGLSDRGLTPS